MARRQVNIYINGRQVTNTIKDITAEKRKLNRELNRMVVGSDEYNEKMQEIKGVNRIIREHRDALRPVSSTYDKLSAGLKSFAGFAAAAFSVEAIIGFGRELFKLGAEMEALTQKAQIVFGSALPLVTAEAEKNAAAMGLTISAYTDAAAAIGDLLVPMGFQREEAADISTQLVNLSGALSEWTGGQVSAEQASNALSKALLGEREELKTLGIAISEADVQARVAEEGLDNLTGAAREQAEAAATLALILEKSSDAQAAFAQNSDLSVRKQAELNAKLLDIKETLALALLPVFDRLLSVAADITDGLLSLSDAAAGLLNPVQGAADAFDQQSAKVSSLEKELVPLLERYDELTGQTSLTQEEQDELGKVIQRIGEVTPGAITQIDEYGRVLGINADASREFLQAEQARLRFVNQESIATIEKEIARLRERAQTIQQEVQSGRGFVVAGVTDLIPEEIAKRRENLIRITEKLTGAEAELARLRGDNITNEPQQQAVEETAKTVERIQETVEKSVNAEKVKEAVDKNIEQLQRLQDKVQDLQRDFAAGQGTDEEQALARIRERYRAQIEEAKRLELEGNAEIAEEARAQRVELERLEQLELQQVREEYQEQRRLSRQEAEETIRLALADEYDQQLIQLSEQYAQLILLAQQYGLDVTALQQKFEEEKTRIQKAESDARVAQEKSEAEQRIEAQRKQAEGQVKAFGQASQAIAEFQKAFGEQGIASVELSKALALAQIGISSARAIAEATAASAGIPFPGNLVAIATAVGTVLANIVQARNILSSVEVPQAFTGGAVSVTGAQDGRSYRARPVGAPGTGLLPPGPALVDTVGGPILANERGQEYFVAAEDMRNPTVLNYVRAIENLRLNRSGALSSPLPQRQEGGAVSAGGGMDPRAVNALIAVNQELVRILRAGIVARIENETVLKMFDRFDNINSAGENAIS